MGILAEFNWKLMIAMVRLLRGHATHSRCSLRSSSQRPQDTMVPFELSIKTELEVYRVVGVEQAGPEDEYNGV